MPVETLNLTRSFSTQLVAAELLQAEMESDPIIQVFPPSYNAEYSVIWEQQTNPFGKMELRGIDGQPVVTPIPGYKRFSMDPGLFGSRFILTEKQMLEQRKPGTASDPMGISTLVMLGMENLLGQSVVQIRDIVLSLLLDGTFLTRSAAGDITYGDTVDNYSTRQKFVPTITWSTAATAVPIFDLLTWKAQLQAGRSTTFGPESTLYMNELSLAEFLKIDQISNKIRIDGGDTVNGLKKVNQLLGGYDLPQIELYDAGYYPTKALADNPSNWVRQLTTRRAIWVGKRKDGEPIGQWQFTRSLAKESMPGGGIDSRTDEFAGKNPISSGMYTLVQHQLMPPTVIGDVGFNGGPAFVHPEASASITWT